MRVDLASLVEAFRRHGAETAIVRHRAIRSERTSYGELAVLAGRFAAELRRCGVAPGERVVLWGANSAEWVAAFFGCVLCGVLPVPLDAGSEFSFAARVIGEVTPRLVLVDAAQAAMLPPLPGVAVLRFAELEAVLPAEPSFAVDPAVGVGSPLQIIFTSGTTAAPKGIVHTHGNVLASLGPIEAEIGRYRRYERVVHPLRLLVTLPLSHVFGQFLGLWVPALLAAEVHFSDQLSAGRLVRLVGRAQVHVLVAVPRVLGLVQGHLLAEEPGLHAAVAEATRLPMAQRWWRFRRVHRRLGWRFWAVISGGAALPAELEQFWNRLGFALIQGYGMTETAALVTLNHPFRVGQGTIGKALPGREVRVNAAGELEVRGAMLAGATWEGGALRPRPEEWLQTGDLAEQNAAGEFRFVGRKGDAIVLASGLNVHPGDLEAALLRQPGVRACAVVPCELGQGPEPVAVVLFAGEDAALDAAVTSANGELAGFQQLRRVLRWPEPAFPYTSTGKLLRRVIREWACQELASRGSGAAPSRDVLLAAIATVTGEDAPREGAETLRLGQDLHLDSLARVQLAATLEERTGVHVAESAMASVETLGELRRVVGVMAEGEKSAGAVLPDGASKADEGKRVRAVQTRLPGRVQGTGDQAAAAAAVYPRWPWSAPLRLLRGLFVEGVLRPLVGVLLAPRVVAPRPVPARLASGQPMLVIANHVTALDGALVLHALPAPLRRRVAVMMSGEMLMGFRSGQRRGVPGRVAYWLLLTLFNVFPLPRLQGFRQSFEHAGEALDRGFSVLIFPEGRRSHTGEPAPFRPGIGLLAAEAGVPVLPVALLGLDRIARPGARWLRSGALEVRIGTPLPFAAQKTAGEWTAELQAALRALLV